MNSAVSSLGRAAHSARLEGGLRSSSVRLFIGFALAFLLTGAPILLHLVAQPLAIAFCVCFAALVAAFFDEQAPTVLLVAYIFQGTFVALASPYVQTAVQLVPMKSYDFITTLGIWVVMMARFAAQRRAVSPFVRRLVYGVSAILLIGGLFFVAGLRFNARNSTIYMRNVGLPVILFQICLLAAARHAIALRRIITIILAMLIVCGYFELLDVNDWLALTNGWRYLDLSVASQLTDPYWISQMQQTGTVITSPLDFLRVNFLNLTFFGNLGMQITRLQGPNFHPISFGYSLAAFMTFAALHRRILLSIAAFPLLLFASAKGALVMLLVCLAFSFASAGRLRSLAAPALLLMLGLYAIFVFLTGRSAGDFHVLGLLGGLNGFVRQPWGHTLGQGGNLSTHFSKINWSKFQHAGAADTALESAIGVMLYQMGVAAIPVLLVYMWIARICWRLHRSLRSPALAMSASAIAVVLVNGIFQEEALFAPLALGLVMAFAGLALGATDRLYGPQLATARPPHFSSRPLSSEAESAS